MNHDEHSIFNEIREAFLAKGQAFPITEKEVEAMEMLLEEEGYPELPKHLQGKTLAKSIIEKDSTNIIPFKSLPFKTHIQNDLSRAARNGKGSDIPPEIEEKMRKDKANHESSSK